MNEVIVEVTDESVDERGGNFKGRDGEDIAYNVRTQDARMEVGGFAYPFAVRLEEGQKPYPKGRYTLAMDKMVQVTKKVASLSKFTHLRPIAVAAK